MQVDMPTTDPPDECHVVASWHTPAAFHNKKSPRLSASGCVGVVGGECVKDKQLSIGHRRLLLTIIAQNTATVQTHIACLTTVYSHWVCVLDFGIAKRMCCVAMAAFVQTGSCSIVFGVCRACHRAVVHEL